jgi:hypothetical protein
MDRSLRVSLWAVTALLTACGGGGGSSGGSTPTPPPPPPPPPSGFNAKAAWQNLLTGNTTHLWTGVVGTANNGNAYTITLASANAGSATFPVDGKPYMAGDITGTVGIGGIGLNSSTSRSYYDPATLYVWGTRTTINSNPATCSVASTTPSAPPTAADIGASGPLQSLNDLNGCLPTSTVTGTTTTTWSVKVDGTVNLFCLNTTASTYTESDCFEVATNGDLGARAWVHLAQSTGLTLDAKNY